MGIYDFYSQVIQYSFIQCTSSSIHYVLGSEDGATNKQNKNPAVVELPSHWRRRTVKKKNRTVKLIACEKGIKNWEGRQDVV